MQSQKNKKIQKKKKKKKNKKEKKRKNKKEKKRKKRNDQNKKKNLKKISRKIYGTNTNFCTKDIEQKLNTSRIQQMSFLV